MAPFNENEAEESAGEQLPIDPGPEGDFDETTGRKAWAIFHEEYFRKVLGYRDRRGELREKTDRVLGELGISTDYGSGYPAGDMDPFTLVSKVASSDRKRFERGRRGYELIKGEFGLAARVPSDLNGLPRCISAQTVFSRFTDMSWEFFEAAMTYRDDQSEANRERFVRAFDAIISEKGTWVAAPKAAVALFGMDPYFYPTLDSYAYDYYRDVLGISDSDAEGGINMRNITGESYLRLKEEIRRRCPDRDFRTVSYDAWMESQRSKTIAPPEVNMETVDGIYDGEGQWWPSQEVFRTQVSEEQWVSLLHDPSVFDESSLRVVKQISMMGGDASYKELADKFGNNMDSYKTVVLALCKRVQRATGCEIPDEQGAKYWPIMFLGKRTRGVYAYKLREELAEAMEESQDVLAGVEVYSDSRPAPVEPSPVLKDCPLNTIFYGPPGTGKTFAAKRRAVEIVSGRDDIGEGEYAQLYERYCSEGRIRMVTFHQSYSYEDFVCGICPSLSGGALSYRLRVGSFLGFCYPGLQSQVDASGGSPLPTEAIEKGRPLGRRVLIIDEINRGNVASIFGELMTLLEGSKRLGGPDQSRASVPSLGSEVGVPGDVYVIGTMNTADRSLVYLDAALRRRFRFMEMQPRADLVGDVDGVRLGEVLSEINRRIELLLDRDHAMGHSEFMAARTLDDVRELFARSVIPLLQDYFFDDYGRIVSVLSRKGRPAVSDFVRSEADSSFGEERRLFRITPPEGWTAETFNGIVGEGDGQRPGSGRRVGAHSHRPR